MTRNRTSRLTFAKLATLSTATAVLLGAGIANAADAGPSGPGPLMIARQGSMEAGGRTINCATNDGGAGLLQTLGA